MPKLFKVLSAKEILKCLFECVFEIKSQEGVHIKVSIKKDEDERILVVPNHKQLDHGTIRSIYRQVSLILNDTIVLDKHFKN